MASYRPLRRAAPRLPGVEHVDDVQPVVSLQPDDVRVGAVQHLDHAGVGKDGGQGGAWTGVGGGQHGKVVEEGSRSEQTKARARLGMTQEKQPGWTSSSSSGGSGSGGGSGGSGARTYVRAQRYRVDHQILAARAELHEAAEALAAGGGAREAQQARKG